MTTGWEMTVREAAQRTHRSEETIRRWIWSGRLPAGKRGNSYYIDIAHLEQVAVVYDARLEPGTARKGDLRSWLDDLDRWKDGLPAATGASASSIVIGDRYARR